MAEAERSNFVDVPCEKCPDRRSCETVGRCRQDTVYATTAQLVIETREATHGDYREQAGLAQRLKDHMRDTEGWTKLNVDQKETLDMIMVKVSRILHGNPHEPDHWLDISGYSTLVHNLLTKGNHL